MPYLFCFFFLVDIGQLFCVVRLGSMEPLLCAALLPPISGLHNVHHCDATLCVLVVGGGPAPVRYQASAQTKSGGKIVVTTCPFASKREAVWQAFVKHATVAPPASLTVYWAVPCICGDLAQPALDVACS